jgi:hypothetical protein
VKRTPSRRGGTYQIRVPSDRVRATGCVSTAGRPSVKGMRANGGAVEAVVSLGRHHTGIVVAAWRTCTHGYSGAAPDLGDANTSAEGGEDK